MLRMTIRVTGDKQVMHKLAILRRAGIDNKDVMQEIGKEAVSYYESDSFSTRGRVFGSAWKDLSPAYKVAKQEKWGSAYPILVASGDMQRGFFARATKNSVTIDNKSPYYKYHQSSASRTKMPRRQMAGINNPIKRIVKDAITKDINRKLRAAA